MLKAEDKAFAGSVVPALLPADFLNKEAYRHSLIEWRSFYPRRPPSRAVISEWHRLHRARRLLSTWAPPLESGRIR